MKKLILVSLLVALLASACYNEGQLVVNPAPLTQYMFQPTESKLRDVAKAYAEAINYNLEKGTLHPGLYADYGVALARLGCIEQANVMFNNEKVFFPNSTAYVDYLISVLTPGMKAVSHIDTSRINIKTLDTIKVTLTPEEEAFQRQLDNDPEYQRLLKQQMKEEKEQKALETKKAKAEMAKAKEAERKAKAKAKEKAQKEKAAAKKEAEKARKQAAKEAEKAKKEAAKAKKKEAQAAAKAKKEAEDTKRKSKETQE
ncbi:MAG: DUF4810 domain-containing protein [Bacteroidales bacterium]|nr:DUF4810 domain-containing protein [Bacteroidales bacterium]